MKVVNASTLKAAREDMQPNNAFHLNEEVRVIEKLRQSTKSITKNT